MSQDIARKTTSHPVRLQSLSIVMALTTALARPQVDTLGIEFHQEDVIRARVGVPIQGAFRVACHPGIASVVHLRKDRQLSFCSAPQMHMEIQIKSEGEAQQTGKK